MDRRKRNIGPPPGTPERRRLARYEPVVSLGAIMQAVTVLASIATALWQADNMLASIRSDLHRIVASELQSALHPHE